MLKDKSGIKDKVTNFKKRTKLEKIILDLEKVSNSQEAKIHIELLKKEVKELELTEEISNQNKKYLAEIIKEEKPQFGSNNLILAPVGSGKSTLIEDQLLNNQKGKVLMLVSNRYLKEDVCPHDSKLREQRAAEGKSKLMFTSRNRNKYGMGEYEVHVMTYSELGFRISDNNDFLKDIEQIYCDEVHSLPEYRQISSSESLIHAIKYLFNKQEGKQIFYFTATNDNLNKLTKKRPALMKYVKTFDYRNHKDIMKYMNLSKYKLNYIEQIRPHLKARTESFEYFGYKGLAFSKTIKGQKKIGQILVEEGYKPLLLWSDSNNKQPLSEEQLKARQELIETNKIPKGYNFLVINSAMREGWDLKDSKVKLAIMNTTNNTDFIQARGRIRQDLDVLLYRTLDENLDDLILKLPEKYENIPLCTEQKSKLCEELKIIDSKGRLSKWNAIKKHLLKSGYDVIDTKRVINGKQVRVSIITKL